MYNFMVHVVIADSASTPVGREKEITIYNYVGQLSLEREVQSIILSERLHLTEPCMHLC